MGSPMSGRADRRAARLSLTHRARVEAGRRCVEQDRA
jgi:hypothetical protein